MTDKPDPSDAQAEVLDLLPATLEELSDELNISRSGVSSRISRLREKGYDINEPLDDEMYYPPESDNIDLESCRSSRTEHHDDIVDDLRAEGLTFRDFGELYDMGRTAAEGILEDLRESGHNIEFKRLNSNERLWYIASDTDQRYEVEQSGTYTFGLMSDTHLGSSAEHLEELHDYYDRLQERGVEHVYHAGDISDGWQVHKGHINVIKGEAAGWERLLDYVVENYPQRDGITTYFIEGNHDHKFYKRNGLHLGEQIAQRRDDLVYCGDSQARFVFDRENDIDLEVIHPSGGKPYTQGYRAQTLYRERPPEDRPTISGIGHLHGKMYASAEDVEAFYTGCWKGLTTYGKRKGHDSEIGGWIVEIEIEDGELRRLTPDWIGYPTRDGDESVDMRAFD